MNEDADVSVYNPLLISLSDRGDKERSPSGAGERDPEEERVREQLRRLSPGGRFHTAQVRLSSERLCGVGVNLFL